MNPPSRKHTVDYAGFVGPGFRGVTGGVWGVRCGVSALRYLEDRPARGGEVAAEARDLVVTVLVRSVVQSRPRKALGGKESWEIFFFRPGWRLEPDHGI